MTVYTMDIVWNILVSGLPEPVIQDKFNPKAQLTNQFYILFFLEIASLQFFVNRPPHLPFLILDFNDTPILL